MHRDDTALTLGEARRMYFARNHFGPEGGYGEAWVKFKVGPFPVAFPNTPGRVRAVRFHDLHHVVTGYPTTLQGEGQIGAWEIATGCADHWAAWGLNLTAMTFGLLLAPRAVFRAFVRGRHSRNLYRETFSDTLLGRTVGATRADLGLDAADVSPNAADIAAFGAWCLVGMVGGGTALALGAVPLGLAMALTAANTARPT